MTDTMKLGLLDFIVGYAGAGVANRAGSSGDAALTYLVSRKRGGAR